MFGLLKKKLKESVKKLSSRGKEKAVEVEQPKAQEKLAGQTSSSGPIEKIKKSSEEIKKEVEHIAEEQGEGNQGEEIDEELEEEIIEEESEEEAESKKEPVAEPEKIQPEEEIEGKLNIKFPEEKGKRGFRQRFFKKIKVKTLSEKDIEEFFLEIEPELLEANVAVEVVEFIKKAIKEDLVGKEARRIRSEEDIKRAFEDALVKVVDQGKVNLHDLIKKSRENKRAAVVVFLGFNGSGKTTSIAKVANYLNQKGFKPVLAAADTFRAAAIDQLETHADKIGVKIIKHQYGSDSAAVIFDAVKHAQAKGMDIVLADTAGRTHTNTNLIDELKKVVRVNKPDLKVLVIDGLTGNDAVEQAKQFNSEIGVDAVVITKVDVDEKGGAILSVAYTIKKPILFLGTGQSYVDFKEFDPREFVKSLLE